MFFNSALEINWLFPNGAKITSFILSRKSESKQWGSIINVYKYVLGSQTNEESQIKQ